MFGDIGNSFEQMRASERDEVADNLGTHLRERSQTRLSRKQGVRHPSTLRYSCDRWQPALVQERVALGLPRTIAVDGPAGSGKSSVSFAVARKLGYLFVDTGAFYRAITLLALRQGIDPTDAERVAALARATEIDLSGDLRDDGRQYTLVVNGEDITWQIHSPEVDAHVSVVAANPGVRQAMLAAQRALAARGGVIMAGRDIGTVVLPDADLKIYIDAALEQRAERRYRQRLQAGEEADLAAIYEGLRRRDATDSQREVAPLLRAPDAIYLDTTSLSLDEAIEAAYQIVLTWERQHQHPTDDKSTAP